ncbi:MAG: Mor transcription activator family protein [Romboutsia sp.]
MKLKHGDVCENMDALFELVGEEKFLEITKLYGGNNVYIPTYKSAIRNSRNREIRRKYNGVNTITLASEYGMSSNQIKKIVKSCDYK